MVDVGDRVLVIPSFGENVAVPLGELSEGDKVILYTLKDETRIAVPTLLLSIGDRVFSSPSFDFAGFNFDIDFDFNLIPLAFLLDVEDADVVLNGVSGDYPVEGVVVKYVQGQCRHGVLEYNFGDPRWMEEGADDGAICIGRGSLYGYHVWIMPARFGDGGSSGSQWFSINGTVVWSGYIAPRLPLNTIVYQVDNWTP